MRCKSIRSRRVCISSEFKFSFYVLLWLRSFADEELTRVPRLDMGSKL
jgi:hypothetical protein